MTEKEAQALPVVASPREQAVHWRAVLAEDQRPQQLNAGLHFVGFRDIRSAEAWIASEKDFKGWNYTLEPLCRCAEQAVPSADAVDAERWRTFEKAGGDLTLLLHNLRPDQRRAAIDASRAPTKEQQ